MSGRVEAIWLKRVRRGPMDRVERAELVAGRGMAGNADQGGKRQVTLMEREVWDQLMQEVGAEADPSARRANILVTGVVLRETRGKLLRIGPCRVRIWGETRPCERVEAAATGLREAMKSAWRGGAFAEVMDSGTIAVGDEVAWESGIGD